MALLELLAATARARFVAAHADVRVASQCRGGLGDGGLAGAPEVRVAACNKVVRRGLARHHRLWTAPLAPARRARDGRPESAGGGGGSGGGGHGRSAALQ